MTRVLENIFAAGLGALGTYGLMKKRRRPVRKRHQHFLSNQHGTQIPISQDLLGSAECLLVNALEERKRPVWRTRHNHSTWFAPGVVVTVLTAFDAWLSELIGSARISGSISHDEIVVLIEKPLADRYRDTAQHLTGKRLSASKDLKLLSTLRHEIVHFLPYVQDITSGETVPPGLGDLESRQLLITSGDPSADFHFSQKLGSYALGYWACETAFSAARDFAAALRISGIPHANIDNFAFYQSIAAPSELPKFDKQFALTLTR
jgi:hypothetical protein